MSGYRATQISALGRALLFWAAASAVAVVSLSVGDSLFGMLMAVLGGIGFGLYAAITRERARRKRHRAGDLS